MIGAFWNIRGLNKAGRHQCLTDFVNNNNLDFVAIMETKKEKFEDSFLSSINYHFKWHVLPAVGTSGGIVFGADERSLEVISCLKRQFSISMLVKNTRDNFVWRVIVVYGCPYDEGKGDFITELHEVMLNWSGPTIVGGDFNMVCNQSEKSNGMINHHWSDCFNDWINSCGLMDYKNPTRSFTWSNNQEQPIMAAIDKVFCTTDFDQHYPLASISAGSRAGSDHVPLILNLGETPKRTNNIFRFEKWWLERERTSIK